MRYLRVVFLVLSFVTVLVVPTLARAQSSDSGSCGDIIAPCAEWAGIIEQDMQGLGSDFRIWAWAAVVLLVILSIAASLTSYWWPEWHYVFPGSPMLRWVAPGTLAVLVAWGIGWALLAADIPSKADSRLGPSSKRVANVLEFYETCEVCAQDGTELTKDLIREVGSSAGEGESVSRSSISGLLQTSAFEEPFSWPWVQAGVSALLGLLIAIGVCKIRNRLDLRD